MGVFILLQSCAYLDVGWLSYDKILSKKLYQLPKLENFLGIFLILKHCVTLVTVLILVVKSFQCGKRGYSHIVMSHVQAVDVSRS